MTQLPDDVLAAMERIEERHLCGSQNSKRDWQTIRDYLVRLPTVDAAMIARAVDAYNDNEWVDEGACDPAMRDALIAALLPDPASGKGSKLAAAAREG